MNAMIIDRLILEAALEGLEAKLTRIDAMIAALKRQGASGGGSPVVESAAKKPRRKKRELSPEARQRIAEAQKKRWAKVRKLKR